MCGIVGAVSTRNIVPILVEGLKRLEYRGYDSCGVAVHQRRRTAARAQHVARGRARGAGRRPSNRRRHRHRPHPLGHARRAGGAQRAPALLARRRARRRIALVHNGIIENHDELRAELEGQGLRVRQPDRHRGHRAPGRPPVRRRPVRRRAAARAAAARRLRDRRVLPRRAAPRGRRARRLAAGARRRQRRRELPRLRRDGAGRRDRPDRLPRRRRRGRPAAGQALDQRRASATAATSPWTREVRTVQAHTGAAELGPYRHYMQKEIFEQPRAIADTLDGVAGIRPELFGDGALPRVQGDRPGADPGLRHQLLRRLDGASTGSRAIAEMPTNVEIASEYRYRDSVPNPRTLVVTITPERRDGRHAGRAEACAQRSAWTHTLTICNVATSAMVRECKLAYITRAGVEIGVASTKAFTTQLVGAVPADAGAGPGARPPRASARKRRT